MARRTGLVVDPLEDDLTEDEQRTAVEAAVATGSREADLDVNKVAPDPENPKGRLSPKENLVNGIKEAGQNTAGMVQPLDRWIAQGGNAEELPDGTEYVIVFGHGRWAACRELGRPFRAVINTTIDDLTDHIVNQLQENINREALTPMQEAEGFQRLAKRKLSQRQIASKLGVKQDHVNKRLKLLTLPEDVQPLVDARSITIEAALKLADIAKAAAKPGDDRNAVRVAYVLERIIAAAGTPEENKASNIDDEQVIINQQNAAKRAVAVMYAEFEAENALKAKRNELTKSGATLIENPREYFTGRPRPYHTYELTDADAITAARADGTAVAHVRSGDIVDWYTTQDPEPEPEAEPAEIPAPRAADPAEDTATPATGETPDTTTDATAETSAPTTEAAERAAAAAEQARQDREEAEREQRERQKAAEARAAACIRIAAKTPPREALTDRLARRLLSEDPYEYADDARELAHEWLKNASVIDDAAAATLFTDKAPTLDVKTAGRVAYIYDLALSEARARDGDGWDNTDAEYIQRLKDEAAYQTSEWEDSHFYNQPAPATSAL
ncbi:ParB/RepB/Spo0J family partition protein [Actinoplanes sp. NPDC051851]|uniref:ParB/RepB/Spo0J family partition protein n=1 Tax=Actinoplanes sp. NPDC051851 TaxID=3154753 RepID=UPI00342D5237